jgi:hypothetical protein
MSLTLLLLSMVALVMEIPWIRVLNVLFTVIGGPLDMVSSIQWGFNIILLLACVIYAVAFWIFSRMRSVLQYG